MRVKIDPSREKMLPQPVRPSWRAHLETDGAAEITDREAPSDCLVPVTLYQSFTWGQSFIDPSGETCLKESSTSQLFLAMRETTKSKF